MPKLINNIWNVRLMDEAGGGGDAGGGGTGSLLTPPGGGGGTPSGGGAGDTGNDPNKGGGSGTPDSGTGNPPGGAPPSDWRSALPSELQEDGSIKTFKSVSDLAGAYINARKLISGDKVAVPNKNWGDADWDNFYKKTGLPESVDKYDVKFDDKGTVKEDFSKAFKEQAFKSGIHPRQAQKMADWFNQITVDTNKKYLSERNAEYNTGVEELKKEWGNAFDARINQANKLIVDMGAHEHFQKMGYGSDPTLMKYLGNLAADKFKDPKLPEGGGEGSGARTPAEIDAAISRIMSDPAYFNAQHANHKTLVAEMTALHQEKYPVKKI